MSALERKARLVQQGLTFVPRLRFATRPRILVSIHCFSACVVIGSILLPTAGTESVLGLQP